MKNSPIVAMSVALAALCALAGAFAAQQSQQRVNARSPDGHWISFDSQGDGNREAYLMTAGGCAEQNITRHGATDGPFSWPANGSTVAFNSDRSGMDQIYRGELRPTAELKWTLAGLQPITAEGRNQAPSWAPSTARIFFESRRDGNREVYIMGRTVLNSAI